MKRVVAIATGAILSLVFLTGLILGLMIVVYLVVTAAMERNWLPALALGASAALVTCGLLFAWATTPPRRRTGRRAGAVRPGGTNLTRERSADS